MKSYRLKRKAQRKHDHLINNLTDKNVKEIFVYFSGVMKWVTALKASLFIRKKIFSQKCKETKVSFFGSKGKKFHIFFFFSHCRKTSTFRFHGII